MKLAMPCSPYLSRKWIVLLKSDYPARHGGRIYLTLLPKKHYHNKKELLGTMTVLLGGLVAEELYGDTSTGVANDFRRSPVFPRDDLPVWHERKTRPLVFGQQNHQHFLGRDLWEQKDYSEETAKNIDKEVQNLVNDCYQRQKIAF